MVKYVGRNMGLGMLLGLLIGSGLSLWTLLLTILGGPEVLTRTGFSLHQAAFGLIVGFTFSGMLVGLLLPLRRWAIGSVTLGIVFVLPVYVLFGELYLHNASVPASWIRRGVFIVSTLVGGSLGLWVWWDQYRRR